LAVDGVFYTKKVRTAAASTPSFQSAFSARRRNSGTCGQAGLFCTKAAYRSNDGLVLSERRMTHSANFRATGSEMLAWAALASASLPLRAASITRLTAATSLADVLALGATANGPEAGRTSGLNSAWLSNSAPCKPTLACAKETIPVPLGCGRVCGEGAAFRSGTTACLVFATGGRGRGNGTFCVADSAASAHSPKVAITAKNKPERLRPVASIKPRTFRSIRPTQSRNSNSASPLGQIY